MSKFKMIEAMGLKVETDYRFGTGYPIVNAIMLEKVLSEAPEMVFDEHGEQAYTHKQRHHTARLVCIAPIAKEPLKKEISQVHELYEKSKHLIYSKILRGGPSGEEK